MEYVVCDCKSLKVNEAGKFFTRYSSSPCNGKDSQWEDAVKSIIDFASKNPTSYSSVSLQEINWDTGKRVVKKRFSVGNDV